MQTIVTEDADIQGLTGESVRSALRTDADRCAALCRVAIEEVGARRGGPMLLRRDTGLVAKALLRPGGLDRLLADSRRQVLLGTYDGEIVGLAVGRAEEVGESTMGVIDACYVELAAREVGVGRALLEALVAWFSAFGCLAIDASALPGDRETKSFFEANGFKGRMITYHRALK